MPRRKTVKKQLKNLDTRLDALEDKTETKYLRFHTHLESNRTSLDRCLPVLDKDLNNIQATFGYGASFYPLPDGVIWPSYATLPILEQGMMAWQPLNSQRHIATESITQGTKNVAQRIGNEISLKGIRLKYRICAPPLPKLDSLDSDCEGGGGLYSFGHQFYGCQGNFSQTLPNSNMVRVMVFVDKNPRSATSPSSAQSNPVFLADLIQLQGTEHNYGGVSNISSIMAPRTLAHDITSKRYSVLYDKVHKINLFGYGVGSPTDTGIVSFTRRFKRGLKVVYDQNPTGGTQSRVIRNNIWIVAFSEYGIIGDDGSVGGLLNVNKTFYNCLPLVATDMTFFYEDS